jgi:hypothetical protein
MDYAGFFGKIQRSLTGLTTCFSTTGTEERDYSRRRISYPAVRFWINFKTILGWLTAIFNVTIGLLK